MKKWSVQDLYEIGDSLQGERKKDWDDLMSKHPTTSLSVWREVCNRQSEYFAEFTGCKCANSIKEQMKETIDVCEQFTNGNFTAVAIALGWSKELNKRLQSINNEYTRDHKCHFNSENFLVCYCDEHSH